MATVPEYIAEWLEVWYDFIADNWPHRIEQGQCVNRGRHQNWPKWDFTIWVSWNYHTRN